MPHHPGHLGRYPRIKADRVAELGGQQAFIDLLVSKGIAGSRAKNIAVGKWGALSSFEMTVLATFIEEAHSGLFRDFQDRANASNVLLSTPDERGNLIGGDNQAVTEIVSAASKWFRFTPMVPPVTAQAFSELRQKANLLVVGGPLYNRGAQLALESMWNQPPFWFLHPDLDGRSDGKWVRKSAEGRRGVGVTLSTGQRFTWERSGQFVGVIAFQRTRCDDGRQRSILVLAGASVRSTSELVKRLTTPAVYQWFEAARSRTDETQPTMLFFDSRSVGRWSSPLVDAPPRPPGRPKRQNSDSLEGK